MITKRRRYIWSYDFLCGSILSFAEVLRGGLIGLPFEVLWVDFLVEDDCGASRVGSETVFNGLLKVWMGGRGRNGILKKMSSDSSFWAGREAEEVSLSILSILLPWQGGNNAKCWFSEQSSRISLFLFKFDSFLRRNCSCMYFSSSICRKIEQGSLYRCQQIKLQIVYPLFFVL